MFKNNYFELLSDLFPSLLLKDLDSVHQTFESSKLRNFKNKAKDSRLEAILANRHFLFRLKLSNLIYRSINQFFIKWKDHYFPLRHHRILFRFLLKLLSQLLLQSSPKKPNFHQKMRLFCLNYPKNLIENLYFLTNK